MVCLLTVAGFLGYKKLRSPIPKQRALTRLTFDEGLQIGATWSPDSRFIAYSSDRGGKFDIWVQQVSGGDPVQITKGPGNNWQSDWSPDGKYIAYRSENGDGGLFVIPALGGSALERKIASFGYAPRWSPDSSRILFKTHFTDVDTSDTFYVVGLDGGEAREVAGDFVSQSDTHEKQALSAAWHPDGKRITLRTGLSRTIPSFWTLPIAGGLPVRTDIPTEIAKQLSDVSSEGQIEGAGDFKFCWNRAGTAIYFAPNFRGARNIWRLSIDPETLQATAIERVTTGPGLDSEFSLSPDGNRIAFTDQKRRVRAWVLPFNATSGRILGSGQALTSTSVDALRHNLSRDGNKLAFVGVRAGRWELMEASRATGRETLIIANDSYRRDGPQWSPDGTQLAYVRYKYSSGEGQLMVWSSLRHDEEPLTTLGKIDMLPYDWSPDGKSILISQVNGKTGREEIWQVPVDARPHAESSSRRIISDPSSNLYQGHFSPDGRLDCV